MILRLRRADDSQRFVPDIEIEVSIEIKVSPRCRLSWEARFSYPDIIVTSVKVPLPLFRSSEFGCFPFSPNQAPRNTNTSM